MAYLEDLVCLTKAQVKPSAEMFARALQDDPLYTCFIPNSTERKDKSHILFEGMLRYGVLYGEVYATSPNLEGVASWVPSEKVDFTTWRIIRSGIFSVFFGLGKKVISRMLSFGDYTSSLHRNHASSPHLYLFMIGVDPIFQGKGYASKLLKPMFLRIDQEHLPCYLETHNEKNVSIYQHFGFEVVEEGTIPGTNVTHWGMLRDSDS